MKIGFVHYNWKMDGVTRVVLNNIDGIVQNYLDTSITLVGEVFEGIPGHINCVSCKFQDVNEDEITRSLHDLTCDYQAVIIENPMIGSRLIATKAFKQFTETTSKRVIWRHHDLIDDRPQYHGKFLEEFGDLSNAYPQADNVQHLVLTSYNQRRLDLKGIESKILTNSIILRDFQYNEERSEKLRRILENDGIVNSGENVLAYPSRILGRKNIEEALLLTKMLNQADQQYRLVVTLNHDQNYEHKLRQIAEEHNILHSFGEVQKYITFDGTGFSISDFYGLSRSAITTSVDEGFGFGFVEPLLSRTPLIGRDLPNVTEDFNECRIRLDGLYTNEDLVSEKTEIGRLESVRKVLGDKEELDEASRRLNLEERLRQAEELVDHNDRMVRETYSHISIAQQLYRLIS